MQLTLLDWAIVAAAFAVYLAVGLWAGRTAGGGYDDYFLGGRGQPWWLLGTSMVATTWRHSRSRHTSTRAPSVPPAASSQRNTGRREVTTDVAMGAMGRGSAMRPAAARCAKSDGV